MDYLTDNYIDCKSRFPPEIWSDVTASSVRTVNTCKSFYAKFNSSLYSPHPDIFTFLDVLKEFQIDTNIVIRTSERKEKKLSGASEKTIVLLKGNISKYKANALERLHFVKIMANKFKPLQ